MPFSDIQRQLVRKIVGGFCEQKVPDHQKNQVRVFYDIKGYTVTLIQSKPSFPGSHLWTDYSIAKLKYDPRTFKWQLYAKKSPDEWEGYPGLELTQNLQSLIDEIASDPLNVFWG